MNTLSKKIMRRVYYAFALRLALHPVTLHALVLLVSLYALTVVLHVASIIDNLSAVRVGDLGNYTLNAFMQTDLWTLVVLGVVIFTAISFPFKLKAPRRFGRNIQTV